MRTFVACSLAALSLGLSACPESDPMDAGGGGSSAGGQGTIKDQSGFLLAQASFNKQSKPLPSTLVIARRGEDDTWTSETLFDEGGGNVFHKAAWFEPVSGQPGILTISANSPFVKIWRKPGSTWEAETIWSGHVGTEPNAAEKEVGKDRLRDMEIGDVTGDGVDDIVIVTHDKGVVMMLEQKDGAYPATRIADPGEEWWIHECELGDANGNGQMEIYCTPSAPNTLGADKEQPGFIKRYEMVEGQWQETVVDQFKERHVKEVLCTDFFGTGTPVVFASIEGDNSGSHSSSVKLYRWDEAAPYAEEVMSLPGQLCRFLACGDTTGDGKNELIAATFKNGIFAISYDAETKEWSKQSVVSSLVTGSFEHAIWLRDLDGDGAQDIVTASDNQKRLQTFRWNKAKARYERGGKLMDLHKDGEVGAFLTFNMTTFDRMY